MAETGRAAVFTGVRQPFEIREYTVPEPKPADMVVRVTRTNICGTDLHLWRGDTDLSKVGITYGIVLGHEMCGVVHKLGAKMRTDSLGQMLREGDRVVYTYYFPCGRCIACLRGCPHMCMTSMSCPVRPCDMAPHFTGGFADYYYVKRGQAVFKVPDSLESELVAGANCALSQVLFGLQQVHLAFGENVVVQGAGGLGLYATAIAKEMGANKVIVVDGIAARLEMAKRFGADEVIDISQIDDPRARVSQVQQLTEGWGADVVVEVVGKPEVCNEGIRMLARGGRYLVMGNINPKQTYKADPSLLVGFNRSIVGVSLYPPLALKQAVDFLVRTRDKYPYDALLSHAYPLENIDQAFSESDHVGGCGSIVRASIVPQALENSEVAK
jgi:threonine dehydrogenase-like Zn-dependent dehydrogenase